MKFKQIESPYLLLPAILLCCTYRTDLLQLTPTAGPPQCNTAIRRYAVLNVNSWTVVCVISGFGFYVNIYALLGYYTAYRGRPIPTFQDKLSLPSSRFLEDLTYNLSRNIGTESPPYAAKYRRRAQIRAEIVCDDIIITPHIF